MIKKKKKDYQANKLYPKILIKKNNSINIKKYDVLITGNMNILYIYIFLITYKNYIIKKQQKILYEILVVYKLHYNIHIHMQVYAIILYILIL